MIETDTIKSDPTWTREAMLTRPYTGQMCLQEQLYLYRLSRNRWRKLGFHKLENAERRVIRRILKKIKEIEAAMSDIEKLAIFLMALDEYDEGDDWENLLTGYEKSMVGMWDSEHYGDCTNECQTCFRCWGDQYIVKARKFLAEFKSTSKQALGLVEGTHVALPAEPTEKLIREVDKAIFQHWPTARKMAIAVYKAVLKAAQDD